MNKEELLHAYTEACTDAPPVASRWVFAIWDAVDLSFLRLAFDVHQPVTAVRFQKQRLDDNTVVVLGECILDGDYPREWMETMLGERSDDFLLAPRSCWPEDRLPICAKSDCIEGPEAKWPADEAPLREKRPPPQWDVANLNAFQTRLEERLDAQGSDEILLVVDTNGAAGKSTWTHRLNLHNTGVGLSVDVDVEPKSLLQTAALMLGSPKDGHKPVIALDVDTRCTHPTWSKIVATAHVLKQGRAYHHPLVPLYFHWPQLVVFINQRPSPKQLPTRFKWIVWDLSASPHQHHQEAAPRAAD